MNQYDEIKSLLKKTRMLMEQAEATNLAKSIESEIETDVRQDDEVDVEKVKKDKSKTYRISGGILTMHGKYKKDIEQTDDILVMGVKIYTSANLMSFAACFFSRQLRYETIFIYTFYKESINLIQ
jgi:hypothetical protein